MPIQLWLQLQEEFKFYHIPSLLADLYPQVSPLTEGGMKKMNNREKNTINFLLSDDLC